MIGLKTKTDLQRLVDEGLEESLTLDYKASPSLARDSGKPEELCKDVSALANSAGGQLVYGIEEDKTAGKPSKVDDGVIDPKITKEWIEQILNSKVQPRMDGVRIERIDMETGKFGYVISVQQSQIGPHQAPDGKYYKRFNFQSVPMHDYEIRDIMRRATTPDLFVTLSFLEGNRQSLRFPSGEEESRPFNLIAHIENRSPQPAFHVVIDIGIDADFKVVARGDFSQFASNEQVENTPLDWFRWTLATPPGQPIFKEHPRVVTNNVMMLTMNAQDIIRNQEVHDLSVRVVAPGFSRQEKTGQSSREVPI
jgi:Putative DNA-binding domain